MTVVDNLRPNIGDPAGKSLFDIEHAQRHDETYDALRELQASGGGGGGSAPQYVQVLASGTTQTLAFPSPGGSVAYDITMSENCAIDFSGGVAGEVRTITLILRGGFTPTFTPNVLWTDGAVPAYTSPAVYEFLTVDGTTSIFGFMSGKAFA